MKLIRKLIGMSDASEPGVCPYCKFQLDPSPTRNKLCPSCNSTIFVRHGNQQLFTEEQSQQLDASPEADLKLRQDPIWQKLTASLGTATTNSDFKLMKTRSYQMSVYLHQAGRDNYQVALDSRNSYLMSLKKLGLKGRVQIKTVKETACGECRAVAGKSIKLEQALITAPIPVKVWSNMQNIHAPLGLCECYYERAIY